MRIVAMLRVKNEARWLREVLLSIQPLTTDIIVFDDHSSDDSREIAGELGCAVLRSPYPDGDTDEVRDKNLLLDAARKTDPDYVLAIDGDEVLEAGAADKIRKRMRADLSTYAFPIRYLWNDRNHYRADGVYGRFQRSSLFALAGQPDTVRFLGTPYGGNFHCGNVPHGLTGAGATVDANLLHLGYMHAEDRLRKYAWYNAKDPANSYEDRYRHVAAGLTAPHSDLIATQRRFRAEFRKPDLLPHELLPPAPPADEKCTHGGPLKLFSL